MIKINKEMTVAAVKTMAKAQVMEDIINFLAEKYGADNAKMVRFGTSTSKKNEIGVRIDSVETENFEVNEMVVTVNVTAKEPVNRKTAKKTYVAFNFDSAAEEYDEYIIDKNTKAAEKAKTKEEKIAKDTAARKAKAEAEKAEKAEEVDF